MRLTRSQLRSELLARVEEIGGEAVAHCYQCGNCSAGCPLAGEMNVLPHRVVRLLQLGQVESALSANAIWLCAACQACAARCPRGVDLSRIMEALRVVQLRRSTIEPPGLTPDTLARAPQQAIVSLYRKYGS